MPKNNKWICREWEFDIADTNFKEDDFERINLLKKYGNLLNPKIQVSLTEKKVRICQKRISHKSLEEFKGVKAANEIVKVFSELTLHKIVHGDLCASNIGFDKYGRLLIFDWEGTLLNSSPNNILSKTQLFNGIEIGIKELKKQGYILSIATGKGRKSLDNDLIKTKLKAYNIEAAHKICDEQELKKSCMID